MQLASHPASGGAMLDCLTATSRGELISVGLLLAGLGTLGEAAAPNLELLILGRVIFGLGIGFAMHAAPAYIAETAPASKRGLLIRRVPRHAAV